MCWSRAPRRPTRTGHLPTRPLGYNLLDLSGEIAELLKAVVCEAESGVLFTHPRQVILDLVVVANLDCDVSDAVHGDDV